MFQCANAILLAERLYCTIYVIHNYSQICLMADGIFMNEYTSDKIIIGETYMRVYLVEL